MGLGHFSIVWMPRTSAQPQLFVRTITYFPAIGWELNFWRLRIGWRHG